MKIGRRTLLAGMAALGAASFPFPAFGQPARLRRNILSMSPGDPDLEAFADGIALMRARTDVLSEEYQREFHARPEQMPHVDWRFLPWHRLQLLQLERIIAHLTGYDGFALPYWDYQETGRLPAILLDRSSPLYMSDRRATEATDYNQMRWDWESRSANLFLDTFDQFAGASEVGGTVENHGHNLVHGITGGAMGYPETAPLDPLFWLHHNNVDRVWTTWHSRQERLYPMGFLRIPLEDFVGSDGPIGRVLAGDLLEIDRLGYGFDMLYPREVFNSSDAPPEDMSRRVTEDVDDYYVSVEATGAETELELALPEPALAALRADSDNLIVIEGTGVARFGEDNLRDRVMIVDALTDNATDDPDLRPVRLMASPTFFMPHAAHAASMEMSPEMPGVAHCFPLGGELTNLIGLSSAPVRLRCSTIPFDAAAPERPMPLAQTLYFNLRLRRTYWV